MIVGFIGELCFDSGIALGIECTWMFIKRKEKVYKTKDDNHVDEHDASDIIVVYCMHFANHYPPFTCMSRSCSSCL